MDINDSRCEWLSRTLQIVRQRERECTSDRKCIVVLQRNTRLLCVCTLTHCNTMTVCTQKHKVALQYLNKLLQCCHTCHTSLLQDETSVLSEQLQHFSSSSSAYQRGQLEEDIERKRGRGRGRNMRKNRMDQRLKEANSARWGWITPCGLIRVPVKKSNFTPEYNEAQEKPLHWSYHVRGILGSGFIK